MGVVIIGDACALGYGVGVYRPFQETLECSASSSVSWNGRYTSTAVSATVRVAGAVVGFV